MQLVLRTNAMYASQRIRTHGSQTNTFVCNALCARRVKYDTMLEFALLAQLI